MKECDEVSYGPGVANEYSARSAICGSCIWLPRRQLAERQQETEVDPRHRETDRQKVPDKKEKL